MAKLDTKAQASRREFMRKAAYVAPVILTLSAAPSFCKAGSDKRDSAGSAADRAEIISDVSAALALRL